MYGVEIMRTRKIEKNDTTNKEEVVFFGSKGIDKNTIVCVVGADNFEGHGFYLRENNNVFELEKTSDKVYECTKKFTDQHYTIHLVLHLDWEKPVSGEVYDYLYVNLYLADNVEGQPYNTLQGYLKFTDFPLEYEYKKGYVGNYQSPQEISKEKFNTYFFYKSNKIDGNTYATGSEGVAQDLYQRLSLLQGELVHHINAGFPLMNGNCNKQMLDAYMIRTIGNTPDVQSIISLESKVVDRRYICSFVVNTPYGILTLSEKKIIKI